MSEKKRLNKTAGGEQPNVGTDPMETPQNAPEKTIVSPDPKKVAEHDREEVRRPHTPEEQAERVKNA